MSFLEQKRRGIMGVSRHSRGHTSAINAEQVGSIALCHAYDDPVTIEKTTGGADFRSKSFPVYSFNFPTYYDICFEGFYNDRLGYTCYRYIHNGDGRYYKFYDNGFVFKRSRYDGLYKINPISLKTYYLNTGTSEWVRLNCAVELMAYQPDDAVEVFTVLPNQYVASYPYGKYHFQCDEGFVSFDITGDFSPSETEFRFDLLHGDYPCTLSDTAPANSIDISYIAKTRQAEIIDIPYFSNADVVSTAIRDDGQVETRTVFTLPVLRAYGDYKDEFSYKDGKYRITRKVGCIVLTGDENFTVNEGKFQLSGAVENYNAYRSYVLTQVDGYNNSCELDENGTIFIRHDSTPTVESFKSWLAKMYQEGFPVTILYALENEQTETGVMQEIVPSFGNSTWTFSGSNRYSVALHYASYQKQVVDTENGVSVLHGQTVEQIMKAGLAEKFFIPCEQCTLQNTSGVSGTVLAVLGKAEQNGTPTVDNPVPLQCVKQGTKLTVLGKNLLDVSRCVLYYCTPTDTGIRMNCANDSYCSLNAKDSKNKQMVDFVSRNLGKTFCFSGENAYQDRAYEVVIHGTKANGATYQAVTGAYGANYVSITVASDFMSITRVELRIRLRVEGDDTTSVFNNLQFAMEDTPSAYSPFVLQEIAVPCDLYEGDVWYPMTGKVIKQCYHRKYTSPPTITKRKANEYSFIFSTPSGWNTGLSGYVLCNRLGYGSYDVYYGKIMCGDVFYASMYRDMTLEEMQAQMQEWINSEAGFEVVYKLKTPITEQYDPQTVSLPSGAVNVMQEPTDLQATLMLMR